MIGAEQTEDERMERFTRAVLRHRRLTICVWVVLAVAGAATGSLTTSRLGKTFTLPGQASYRTDQQILADYGYGGDPLIPVIEAPSGQAVTGLAGMAALARAERAASLNGRMRVLGLAGTGDPHFVSGDGRTTFLLVLGPPPVSAVRIWHRLCPPPPGRPCRPAGQRPPPAPDLSALAAGPHEDTECSTKRSSAAWAPWWCWLWSSRPRWPSSP